MSGKLNTIIAEFTEEIDRLDEIILSIKQNASKGSIFHQWLLKHPDSEGILGELSITLRDGKRVILDAHYYEDSAKIAVEVKYLTEARALSGHAERQAEKYGEIARDPRYGIHFIEYRFNTEEAAKANVRLLLKYINEEKLIIKYYDKISNRVQKINLK